MIQISLQLDENLSITYDNILISVTIFPGVNCLNFFCARLLGLISKTVVVNFFIH
jgi:hypothetical protein